ncbi:MAG: hypothetical protein HFI60_00535 [Lachnospiraceae bacterium]|jgi:hypothetical protein|nr:hypothetical protein [Lachnospiraceae bacterium]
MDCSHLAECIQSIESTQDRYVECQMPQCLKSCDTRRIIVVEENKKRYALQNSGDVIAVYRVDGQMIASADRVKCDNMIVDVTSLLAVLVELKGTNLRHALSQIENTYNNVSLMLKRYRLYGRIVTSARTNVPNLKTDPQYMRIQKAFMKHGGNLRTRTNGISECVDELNG